MLDVADANGVGRARAPERIERAQVKTRNLPNWSPNGGGLEVGEHKMQKISIGLFGDITRAGSSIKAYLDSKAETTARDAPEKECGVLPQQDGLERVEPLHPRALPAAGQSAAPRGNQRMLSGEVFEEARSEWT